MNHLNTPWFQEHQEIESERAEELREAQEQEQAEHDATVEMAPWEKKTG